MFFTNAVNSSRFIPGFFCAASKYRDLIPPASVFSPAKYLLCIDSYIPPTAPPANPFSASFILSPGMVSELSVAFGGDIGDFGAGGIGSAGFGVVGTEGVGATGATCLG